MFDKENLRVPTYRQDPLLRQVTYSHANVIKKYKGSRHVSRAVRFLNNNKISSSQAQDRKLARKLVTLLPY